MKIELSALIAAARSRVDAAFTAFKTAQADVDGKRGEIRRAERRLRDKEEGLKEARRAYRDHVARLGAGHRRTKEVSNAITECQHQFNELEKALHERRAEHDRLERLERRANERLTKTRLRFERFSSPEFAKRLKKRAQRIKNRAERQVEKTERRMEKERPPAPPAPSSEPHPAAPDLAAFAVKMGVDLASLSSEDRKALEELARAER